MRRIELLFCLSLGTKRVGSANGNRTRISALKGPRANRCTIAPQFAGVEIREGKLAKVRRGWEASFEFRSTLAVLKFFVPGHLNGFEFGFVGAHRIAGEAGEFSDPFVHVGEAYRERIGAWEFVGQGDGDIFDSVPIKSSRHG
jgi:hypothetical protein